MTVYCSQLYGKVASHINIRFLILKNTCEKIVQQILPWKNDVKIAKNEVRWNIDTLNSEPAAQA